MSSLSSEPSAQKHIFLCADDFGQNELISLGILALAKQQRINAISCLVNMPYWSDGQSELSAVKSFCFIGLHLNLTFGQAMSAVWRKQYGEEFQGLSHLMFMAYTRQLDLNIVKSEIQAQLDVFTQDMQAYPDFIDGHQHVHQFPIIRDALKLIYEQYHAKTHGFSPKMGQNIDPETTDLMPCFLRSTYNNWCDLGSLSAFPKSQALAILGGKTWRKALLKSNIQTNSSFSGLYRFKTSKHYRHHFKRFLSNIQDGGVIMCHPGYPSDDQEDPMYPFRHHELHYLISDDYVQDLNTNLVRLITKIK